MAAGYVHLDLSVGRRPSILVDGVVGSRRVMLDSQERGPDERTVLTKK